MEDKIQEILHTNNHKEKNKYLLLQYTKTLGHDQKTKPKNSQGGRRN
jgi:hypothetical protein